MDVSICVYIISVLLQSLYSNLLYRWGSLVYILSITRASHMSASWAYNICGLPNGLMLMWAMAQHWSSPQYVGSFRCDLVSLPFFILFLLVLLNLEEISGVSKNKRKWREVWQSFACTSFPWELMSSHFSSFFVPRLFELWLSFKLEHCGSFLIACVF